MAAKQILVLGGGFAGLWAAAGAARKLDELGVAADAAEVTLVNRDAYHGIRVRNYEADLSPVRVPLAEVLDPIGVRLVVGDVSAVDVRERRVEVFTASGIQRLGYDRLVLALGSELVRPPIPGLAEFAFDVDTYGGAARLEAHLKALGTRDVPGTWTVLVVGAGLTGIETAAEMPSRLRALQHELGGGPPPRVILADRSPHIGSNMGEQARVVIERALAAQSIETRTGIQVESVDPRGVTLAGGGRIEAATVVWCGGMRAHPLVATIPGEHDRFGRLKVDGFLRVEGLPEVFAAGDVACQRIDGEHDSVMSCQHGRPMGRYAGHNVVADLFGKQMLPLSIDWYVTVLDLGPWGAVYTNGWDRHVVAEGAAAKRTKQVINGERIYPPRSGDRAEILAAAEPVVQRPPAHEA